MNNVDAAVLTSVLQLLFTIIPLYITIRSFNKTAEKDRSKIDTTLAEMNVLIEVLSDTNDKLAAKIDATQESIKSNQLLITNHEVRIKIIEKQLEKGEH